MSDDNDYARGWLGMGNGSSVSNLAESDRQLQSKLRENSLRFEKNNDLNNSGEPNWGLMGVLFCCSWIGAAVKSWVVFGAVFGVFVVIIITLNLIFKGDEKERAETYSNYIIATISLVGLIFICTYFGGHKGLAGSLLGITTLYGLYRFCQTRIAKALGDGVLRLIKYTLWLGFMGLVLTGVYLLLTS